MSRAVSVVPLLALGLASWAALWSLLAVSGPSLPIASERMLVAANEMPVPRRVAAELQGEALRQRLALITTDALRERLGPGYPFELVRVERLNLADAHADVRLWGLLQVAEGPPAMLRVDLRIDRRSAHVERFHAEAFDEQRRDPFLTAWISNGPGAHQAAR